MRIELIDQALNIAITGLLYGSATWFVCAFSRHVATRPPSKGTSANSQRSAMRSPARQQPASQARVAPQKVLAPEKSVIREPSAQTRQSAQPAASQAATLRAIAARPAIACEPVNWKLWKVSDLRKANIAKVCGVRVRPIGARRTLRKADLIAQYEQQLKRFTKRSSEGLVPQPSQSISSTTAKTALKASIKKQNKSA